jgi:hypothetical protein
MNDRIFGILSSWETNQGGINDPVKFLDKTAKCECNQRCASRKLEPIDYMSISLWLAIAIQTPIAA